MEMLSTILSLRRDVLSKLLNFKQKHVLIQCLNSKYRAALIPPPLTIINSNKSVTQLFNNIDTKMYREDIKNNR